MPNFNKVIMMGNLTRDPELRYTETQTPVCNIGLATNRHYRDKNGDTQEEACFIDCEAWGTTAETINKYLHKGRAVLIEGRLRLDRWEDENGSNRSRLKVVIERFQFTDPQPSAPAPEEETLETRSTGGDTSMLKAQVAAGVGYGEMPL